MTGSSPCHSDLRRDDTPFFLVFSSFKLGSLSPNSGWLWNCFRGRPLFSQSYVTLLCFSYSPFCCFVFLFMIVRIAFFPLLLSRAASRQQLFLDFSPVFFQTFREPMSFPSSSLWKILSSFSPYQPRPSRQTELGVYLLSPCHKVLKGHSSPEIPPVRHRGQNLKSGTPPVSSFSPLIFNISRSSFSIAVLLLPRRFSLRKS